MTRATTMKTTAGNTCSCTLGEWRPAPNVAVGLVRSAQMLWWLRGLFGCISVHCLSLMRRTTCVSDSSITSEGKQLREKHVAHIFCGRVIIVVGWNAVLHCCCLLLGRVKNLQVDSVGPRGKNKYTWATIQNEKREEIVLKVGGMLASAWAHVNLQHARCDCANRIAMESSHQDSIIARVMAQLK